MAKILCIGDDHDINELFRLILEREGYTVTATTDGRRGLEDARAGWPDLIIITGATLRPVNGYEIIERIRTDGITKNMPIFLCSARHRLDDEDNSVAAHGCDEYIPKPFTIRDLIARLRSYLEPDKPTPAAAPDHTNNKLKLKPSFPDI